MDILRLVLRSGGAREVGVEPKVRHAKGQKQRTIETIMASSQLKFQAKSLFNPQ